MKKILAGLVIAGSLLVAAPAQATVRTRTRGCLVVYNDLHTKQRPSWYCVGSGRITIPSYGNPKFKLGGYTLNAQQGDWLEATIRNGQGRVIFHDRFQVPATRSWYSRDFRLSRIIDKDTGMVNIEVTVEYPEQDDKAGSSWVESLHRSLTPYGTKKDKLVKLSSI